LHLQKEALRHEQAKVHAGNPASQDLPIRHLMGGA